MALSMDEKITAILEAMVKACEAEGVPCGAVVDARIYYFGYASEEEIDRDYERWISKKPNT